MLKFKQFLMEVKAHPPEHWENLAKQMADNSHMSNNELAAHLNMPLNTFHRHLATVRKRGLIPNSPKNPLRQSTEHHQTIIDMQNAGHTDDHIISHLNSIGVAIKKHHLVGARERGVLPMRQQQHETTKRIANEFKKQSETMTTSELANHFGKSTIQIIALRKRLMKAGEQLNVKHDPNPGNSKKDA